MARGYWSVSWSMLLTTGLWVTTGVHGVWSIAEFYHVVFCRHHPDHRFAFVYRTRIHRELLRGDDHMEQWKVGGTCYSYSSTWDWNYHLFAMGKELERASVWQGRQSAGQTLCCAASRIGAMFGEIVPWVDTLLACHVFAILFQLVVVVSWWSIMVSVLYLGACCVFKWGPW